VIHQILQLAVEDNYIRRNISDNLLKELKSSHHYEDSHRRALTLPEQELFMEFMIMESLLISILQMQTANSQQSTMYAEITGL
jgi:hypothetical protein